ncbi:hypothetical protein ACFSQ7_36535 [Paenibacillus rhizoplanae]
MITVGREIIHRYDDAKPTDMDEFLNSMVKNIGASYPHVPSLGGT